MSNVDEALVARTPLGSDLAAGVDQIGLYQDICFTKYIRLVLPLDGYVFWVKADLVSQSALFNAARYNAAALNQPIVEVTPAPTFLCRGSLHYNTALVQDEDATYSVNQVVFTSEQFVQAFNEAGPNVIYIAEFEGIKFAFSQRQPFYQQARLHHYLGNAVYSTMETQLVNKLDGFSPSLIVSNSLPIWLALNGYQSLYPDRFTPIPMLLFPSFAVPQNMEPPFGAVHIAPESTESLQMMPVIGLSLSHSQLCKERVRVTLYGIDNSAALSFYDCVNQYTLDTNAFGIMNMPAVRDEKKTQVELGILAQKKSIEYEINYNQGIARNVARQLITSCIPNVIIQDQL